MLFIGVDIGGTKCAVNLGKVEGDNITIIHKCEIRETKAYSPQKILEGIVSDIEGCKGFLKELEEIRGIGISCGGPLNSKKGVILSPPNLPGWDNIHITDYLHEKTGLQAWLCNDANACALAEWKLGAGIILDKRLYVGTSDMAGELGHIRLSDYGPTGYGKMGSFEGFCSGGGISQLAKAMIMEQLQKGNKPNLCPTFEDIEQITAAQVGLAAKNGDVLAKDILKKVGIQLGKGLSILIDLLNPECIVIGSIFARCQDEIWPYAEKVIREETLSLTREVCKVVPSQLSESVGDIAGLIIADYNIHLEVSL